MKGATAEPLVSMTKPPTAIIITKIGKSQNFFRMRMKRQSSARKSNSIPSELVLHRLRCRPRRVSLDPIAITITLDPKSQQVSAQQSHHESCRYHRSIIYEAHDNRIDYGMQQQAEFEPYAIERFESCGKKRAENKEKNSDC